MILAQPITIEITGAVLLGGAGVVVFAFVTWAVSRLVKQLDTLTDKVAALTERIVALEQKP